jgi:protein O-GlcNAc transferase
MSDTRKQRRAQEAKLKKSGAVPSKIQQAINSALIMHQSGNLAGAAEIYEKIITIAPSNPDVLHLLGVLSYQKGKFDQAINMISKAIALAPNNPGFYNNLGNAQIGAGQMQNAVASFKKSLALDPKNTDAINNIGAALHELGEWQEEIAYYKQGLAINPNDTALLNELVKTMRDSCDGLDGYIAQLIEASKHALAQNKLPPLTPYHALTLDVSPEFKKQIAENYAAIKFGNIKPAFNHKTRSKNARIKVGYVSADYRNHPTAHLISGLFRLHNRDEFEVYAYSLGKDDGSVYRKQIEQTCDVFVDCLNVSSHEIASRIYNDKIDILVDVMGYIQNARPEIFALRPAPVQINYLAYPGTMGAKFIDYLVSDHTAVSPEQERNYSEKLLFMPHTYFITDNKQEIAATPTRAECGLPEDKFIFCSFNKSIKIDERVFACWMEILKEVENSVLWLFSSNEFTQANLKKQAEKHGIAVERIIFATRMPKAEHLARMRLADLFLDCFTVTAHTTAIDALWAGVPVLTKLGNDIMSRASASILNAAGLPELIMENAAEYKKAAVGYANDANLLRKLKDKLAKNIKTTALFNTVDYAKSLEISYKTIAQGNL